MLSNIKFKTLKVLCPKYNRFVELPIQYITDDGAFYLADSAGCDVGYDGSRQCQECIARNVEIFKANFQAP